MKPYTFNIEIGENEDKKTLRRSFDLESVLFVEEAYVSPEEYGLPATGEKEHVVDITLKLTYDTRQVKKTTNQGKPTEFVYVSTPITVRIAGEDEINKFFNIYSQLTATA